jgi:hypothetical protein
VFGCACYPNIFATSPNKLSPRSTRCLFLGYSPDHKGYRCPDLTSHRIIISRHVVFDEDVFPLAGSTPPTDLDSLLESNPVPPPTLGAPSCTVTCSSCSHDATAHAHFCATRGPVDLACATRGHVDHAYAMRDPVDHACATRGPVDPACATRGPVDPTCATCGPVDPGSLRQPHARLPPPRPRHYLGAPDSGPSTSATRFADPAIVYHRRELATPAALDVPAVHSESSVYHPVAIHRDPGHIHPMVTQRAAGVLCPVDRLILAADTSSTPPDTSPVPSSVRTALANPHWRRAMEEEYADLLANHTWDLVPCPPGTNVVTDKWLFRHKLTLDGSLDRYKARWVLRGFTQRPGVDYDETFSPVVKFATVHVVLSLALSRNWEIHQLDVKNAFLHGTLMETVYCSQPTSFVDADRPDLVCRLNRSLYDLKQAPRAWYSRFASYMASIGFVEAKSDTYILVHLPT